MTQTTHGVDTVGTTIAIRPVVLAAPNRGDDLQVRVTAPLTGEDLPVVVFSHGFGFSMDAYGPIVDVWAANGFVVIQPTHLDSVSLGLAPDDPRGPRIWRYRIEDLGQVLDELDTIVAAVPGLMGRVDANRVAAAGHSYGATTASALLGARVLGPAGDPAEDFTDPRVSAGVLLCLAGVAGDDLTPLARQLFSFMNPSFDHLGAPALIAAGDADQSMLSTRGPDWWADAYQQSPGEKSLLTLFGAEHGLGAIHAYGTIPQTTAENPATVALVQRATTAYLRTALGVDETSWPALQATLAAEPEPAGRLDSK
ncbi:alpha/beta hydrolase family protein [Mycobacteroides franklinii]|uniref:Esterase n=1 Tax=Mycobacteroides franklinii TaxID=948102 RepID=A0A4R8R2D0_9MYCO|nr:alpha/beta fold hydrolase [Mycobacteroides franklinii]TDZ45187.1 esterase [Mycobacteroides franklinii]TDZ48678.1 esterase [Mycobacteroides franklinii]TDZ58859.1 esterase [Mycobacteroides franklinii]TDZ66373.1 esterase [Mycobacteroides franklinii]TDZ72296.1 esterase [Mycobacteroides franklinii]